MKRTIRKWFWMWEFDKEEQWLNKMSAKGLQLCDVGYCRYVFEDGTPGEYIHRLELLDKLPSNAESAQYIRFVEDTGAEHVGSLFRWVYFRKKADENGFDLYSDIDSRIKHLIGMLWLTGILCAANLLNGAAQLNSWRLGYSSLIIVILCLSVAGLCGYGFLRLFLKTRSLKKERMLHE